MLLKVNITEEDFNYLKKKIPGINPGEIISLVAKKVISERKVKSNRKLSEKQKCLH